VVHSVVLDGNGLGDGLRRHGVQPDQLGPVVDPAGTPSLGVGVASSARFSGRAEISQERTRPSVRAASSNHVAVRRGCGGTVVPMR
jgi:hypothetical protein